MTSMTQLFLSLQSRLDADMAEFVHFENQREQPNLAAHGSLRLGCKYVILECIKAPTGQHVAAKTATVVVLDMAAVSWVCYERHDTILEVSDNPRHWTFRLNCPDVILKSPIHQRHAMGSRTRIGAGRTCITNHDWNDGKKVIPFPHYQMRERSP